MVGPDPDLEVSRLVMPTRASKRPAYLQVPRTMRQYRGEGGISPLSTPKCSEKQRWVIISGKVQPLA